MPIKLHVESYCENCHELEPVVRYEQFRDYDGAIFNNTDIYCEHQTRCRNIYERMKRENDT